MWRIAGAGLIGAVGLLFGVQWQPVWVALAGGAGVGATALVSWLLGRRRESGSISTSDAATLWAETRSLLGDYREENGRLRERVAVLEQGREEDRRRIHELEDEVRHLKSVVGEA